MEIKCPRCGGTSYRMRRSIMPIGEHRCCERCRNRFFWQGDKDKAIEEILEPAVSPVFATLEAISKQPPSDFDREIVVTQLKGHGLA